MHYPNGPCLVATRSLSENGEEEERGGRAEPREKAGSDLFGSNGRASGARVVKRPCDQIGVSAIGPDRRSSAAAAAAEGAGPWTEVT